MSDMGNDFITVKEARDILGVSPGKMAQLIRDGDLPAKDSKLDKRIKLVRRSDVEKLATEEQKLKKETPAA